MWSTLIAVIGTLAGAALAILAQRATDHAARAERHRQEITASLVALLEAILRYRENYWLTVAHLRDSDQESTDQRAIRYRLRTEITVARDRLALTARGTRLVELGEKAAWAAIELNDIPLGPVTDRAFSPDTEAALAAGREHSRDAHTALRRAGSDYLLSR
ncbi:hypothetical protein ABZ858_32185 [Streptomyces sp. NPDC047017]|uniref:hypothetical protein n=1 Tax=Streptomyces sp. NPDC047017 TaxID=3155024 RepID=UPI00340D02AA